MRKIKIARVVMERETEGIGGMYKYAWRENLVAMHGEFCKGEGA